MKRTAVAAALLVIAVSGCSSSATSETAGAPQDASPTTVATTSTPSSSAETTAAPSATDGAASTTGTDTMESVGEALGEKIAFYAIAKAAGMTDSAKMDELASGVCSRIESGDAASVGQWMEETFQLTGDGAAGVAVAAIESTCPEYASLVGS